MRELGRIVGHIPARGGSQRVRSKNLRYLVDRPLLAYAVDSALGSEVLDEVYVNTDSDDIAALGASLGAKVYRRAPHLASDSASGDDFNADFIDKIRPDTLVMVNSVCPLVEPQDIRRALEAFRNATCDTLISCQETQMQTFCEGEVVNIDADTALAPTQINPKVQILNWAVTIWDAAAFAESYRLRGNGYLGTHRLLFPLPPSRSVKISHEEDFRLAELLVRARRLQDEASEAASAPRYWSLSGVG